MAANSRYFPMRLGFPAGMAYERTAVLSSRGIAEVPDVSGRSSWSAEELELLHRRQIAKKNADLHGRELGLPSMVRTRYALELVERWFDPRVAEELLERCLAVGKRDAAGMIRVFVMPPIKASFNKNINFLCYVYAAALCSELEALAEARGLRELSFAIDPNLVLTEYAGTRTESGGIGRIARQSMQEALIPRESNVILVDDHAEACSILAVSYDAVARAGGNLVGVSVLSAIPDARNVRVHPAVARALIERANVLGGAAQLDEALAPAGIGRATLTNREALLTYAFLADPADLELGRELHRLLALIGYDFATEEGQYGSLREAFAQAPMSLARLRERVQEEATGNRIELLLPGQTLARRPCLSARALLTELARGAPGLFVKGPDFPAQLNH